MKITIVGRQMTVTDDLKELIEKKLRKFDKFFPDDAIASVKLAKKHGDEVLELTISSGGTLYRGERADATFNNALDQVIEVIEGQLRKNKTRLERRLRDGAFTRAVGEPEEVVLPDNEPEVRVKTFPIKPLTLDEAILQMDLLGHSFYMFRSAESGEINVVYKRHDDSYGLIIPAE